jgi:hypothetical protein
MDERLVKTASNKESNARADERMSADSALATTSERRRMFREFTQEALPTPPANPAWHYCWLSTTNQYDPIYKRMRMGYQPVKADELPEFTHLRLKAGEYEGCVSINEMVLFKLPQEVYQELMAEYHYHMPLEEEERIKQNAAAPKGVVGKDSNGRPLGMVEGDGFENIVHRAPLPTFN